MNEEGTEGLYTPPAKPIITFSDLAVLIPDRAIHCFMQYLMACDNLEGGKKTLIFQLKESRSFLEVIFMRRRFKRMMCWVEDAFSALQHDARLKAEGYKNDPAFT